MIELPDGTVLLRQGEKLPARCPECGAIRVPCDYEVHKEQFYCWECDTETPFGELAAWRLVEAPEEDGA